MEERELVELEVSVRMADLPGAIEEAKDLAWEHTMEYASSEKIVIGSEEFADMFSVFTDRYVHQVEHLKFFMLSAMLTVRHILEEEVLVVPSEDGNKPDEVQITEAISRASRMLTSSYMWLAAGYEVTWPVNDELPEDINVKYLFAADSVQEEKE